MTTPRVALIEVDDGSAAHLLRLHCEHLGFPVALNRPGKPSDFFTGFAFYGQPADIAVICTHGDDGGFIFPEMAAGVDPLILPGNRINAGTLKTHLTSAPGLVVSTACSTGTSAFAAAFHNAGARHYIAPIGDPLGRDVPVFVVAFMHALSTGMDRALKNANSLVMPESRFKLVAA